MHGNSLGEGWQGYREDARAHAEALAAVTGGCVEFYLSSYRYDCDTDDAVTSEVVWPALEVSETP
jgi:hypothetical protein